MPGLRLISILAFLLVASLLAAQDIATMSVEPKASAKVSLRAKDATLASVLGELSKATGLTIRPSTAVASWRVNVFCEDKPAATILDSLAELLFFRWKPGPSGYVLYRPVKIDAEEQDLVEAERQAGASRAKAFLRQVEAIARRPLDDLEAERRSLEEQIGQYEPDGEFTPKSMKLRAERGKLMPFAYEHSLYYLGQLLLDGREDSFLRGEPLWASTARTEGFARLPSDALGNINEWYKSHPEGDVTRTQLASLYQPSTSRIWVTMEDEIPMKHYLRRQGGLRFEGIDEPEVYAATASQPFRQRIDKWVTPIRAGKDPVLDLPLEAQPERRAVKYFGGGASASDLLEKLFDGSKVTVVADSFRARIAESVAGVDGSSVRQFLANLQNASQTDSGKGIGPGYVRVAASCVMYRHRRFWNVRSWDPPREPLVELEQKRAKQKSLSVSDVAKFAAKLSEDQVAIFDKLVPPVLLRIDPQPFQDCRALRFYASLSEVQVADASDGLDFGSLSSSQTSLFWQAGLERALSEVGSRIPLTLLKRCLDGEPLRQPAQLQISMRRDASGRPAYVYMVLQVPNLGLSAPILSASGDFRMP